jgi:hypothetical protein
VPEAHFTLLAVGSNSETASFIQVVFFGMKSFSFLTVLFTSKIPAPTSVQAG